ncbi:MAG: DsrE family protein [Egibacteraceae bacterium]
MIRTPPAAVRAADPALEANAYAIAEDIELRLVLRAAGIELALALGQTRTVELAGVVISPPVTGRDVRGLIESGVRVVVLDEDLEVRGLTPDDLLAGVEVVSFGTLAALLAETDAVVGW